MDLNCSTNPYSSAEHQKGASRPLLGSMGWLALTCAAVGVFVSVKFSAGNHIFLLVPGLIAAVHAIRCKGWQFLPKSAWALLSLCLVGLVANLINWHGMVDPVRATLKLKYFVMGVLGVVAFRWVTEKTETQKWGARVFNLLMISIIVSVLYAVIGHLTGFDLKEWGDSDFTRRGGLTGTMRFGYGMGMMLPVLIGTLVFCRSKLNAFQNNILIGAIVFGVIGLLLTETRGGLLAALIGLGVVGFMKSRAAGIKFMLFGGGVLTLMIAVNISIDSGENNWRSSGYFRGLDDGQRLSIYQGALAAIDERPLRGLGHYQLGQHLSEIKERHGIAHVHGEASHAHNIFLQTGADFGLIGLLALVAWMGLWIRELLAVGGFPMQLGLPFIAAMVVGGQFEYIFDANNSVLIFTVYAISLSPLLVEFNKKKNGGLAD